FELGRQAPSGPVAPRLRLVPAQVDGGLRFVERDPLAEPALLPAASCGPPEPGPPCIAGLEPRPAVGSPVARLPVAAVGNESGKRPVVNGCPVHPKALHIDPVRHPFVVERELRTRCSELKARRLEAEVPGPGRTGPQRSRPRVRPERA